MAGATPSEQTFVSVLAADIEGLLPELRQGVNVLMAGAINHDEAPEDALMGHVCGRATRLLSYQLRQLGYKALGHENPALGDAYPAPDHALIVVERPEAANDVIVDAAYLQFLKVFFLDRQFLPGKEVLVFPVSETNVVASGFTRLRNLKLARHPDPNILRQHSELFRLNDDEVTEYFAHIWDLEAYRPVTRRLEDDIAAYSAGLGSVTDPTRRLIEKLGLASDYS